MRYVDDFIRFYLTILTLFSRNSTINSRLNFTKEISQHNSRDILHIIIIQLKDFPKKCTCQAEAS